MEGTILLANGLRLEGKLVGSSRTVVGWLVANTSVVGFQEMATDPSYKNRILAFTYPEIGNVGVMAGAAESSRFQVSALVVRVLSSFRSHYRSEEDFLVALQEQDIPCLTNIDTRWLAVQLRTQGEMPAAIAPAGVDGKELGQKLAALPRPSFEPTDPPAVAIQGSGAKVAVINLGIRRSAIQQLAICCNPSLHPYNTEAATILESKPTGVMVSDGPGGGLPPPETVQTLKSLLGKVPLLGWGLGHVALGMALGCKADFLKRGHHGANYPIRNRVDGTLQISVQRHSVFLDRDSVEKCPQAEVLWENINDKTVEGIRSADGSAVGMQVMSVPPLPGEVNPHIRSFVARISGK